MISVSLTRKVRLYPTSQQADELTRVMNEYTRLCNLASKYVFDENLCLKPKVQKNLNDALYYSFRSDSFLGAGLVQSVFKTVIARYQTTATQLAKKPMRYNTGKVDKNGKAIWKSIPRDLSWLWKPIEFKRPQADYVRTKNYSLVDKAMLISMNGINGRLKVKYDLREQDFLLREDIKLGTAKLVKSCGHWFFHVSYTLIRSGLEMNDVQHVVGIDRGLRFIATAFDDQGRTQFFSGKKLTKTREHYKRLRKQLQQVGTRSAHLRLVKIGQRENRYVSLMNHNISKALVDKYGKHTLFVLEDLSGVRNATEKVKKDKRYEQVSWPFYQLEQDLSYKANLNGSKVVEVSSYKTSQRCPRCGRINKNNRNHDLHLYVCDRCGYSSNDDRIGAMNIYLLGTLKRSGVLNPSFKKNKEND